MDADDAAGADAVRISVVIPVYNGAATVGALVERLIDVLGAGDLQVVLVDDGSLDDSDAVCRALARGHPAVVTYVRLARNFGEHNAVMAGLRHARGRWMVIQDDDFQKPPEEGGGLVDQRCARRADLRNQCPPRRAPTVPRK